MIDVCAQAIPVNKKYSKAAREKITNPNLSCIAMVPPEFQTHKPICKNNKCSMALMTGASTKDGCLLKLTENERDYCLKKLAKEMQNPSLCNEITRGRRACSSSVVRNLSEESALNNSHCLRLSSTEIRDDCYLLISKTSRKAEPCFKIMDEKLRSKCLVSPSSMVNNDPHWKDLSEEICKKAKNKNHDLWADKCLMNLGASNVKQCQAIEDINLWYYCIRNAALKLKDGMLCDLISDRKFPMNFPLSAYSVSACKKWVSNNGSH